MNINTALGTFHSRDMSIAEHHPSFKATDCLMVHRNLIPADIIAGMCGELIRLTKMAAFQTNQNASWQRTYDEKILHIYE